MGFVAGHLRLFGVSIAVAALTALAGCQSGDTLGALDVSANQPPSEQPKEEPVRLSELRAVCPSVQLREGTAYFSTYQRNQSDDPSKLIYQASISDVTRTCKHDGGSITMDIAVAGRIVPGPLGKTGTITMPIRVVVVGADGPIYSQLHKFPVQVADTIGATQFVFNDSNVVIPEDQANAVSIFAGYDEGPGVH